MSQYLALDKFSKSKKATQKVIHPHVFSSSVLRLKQYIRNYVETEFQTAQTTFIRIPSIKAIALGLRCTSEDVGEALKELKSQGYRYRILDAINPICIWDGLA